MPSEGRAPLWTRSFTPLILGSAVTMLGHALSGFAVSLLVLDYTGSVLLYTIYQAAYVLPMVIMPLLAGPWMARFSRVRMIYGLDFAGCNVKFTVRENTLQVERITKIQ